MRTDALRTLFHMYFSLNDFNPDGICLVDMDAKIIEVNQKYEVISGFSRGELLGTCFTDFIPSVDLKIASSWFAPGAQGTILHDGPTYLVNKLGRHVPILYTRVPVVEHDQVIGLCLVVKDITRQHEIENLLLKNKQVLESSQRIAHLGSWEFDPVNQRSHWTPELFRIYGIEDSGTGFIDLTEAAKYIHPDDKERFIQSAQTLSEGKPYDVEFRIIREDGDTRVIHSRRELFADDRGEVRMIGTAQDITEQKETQDLLLRSERLSAVGQLAAGVAHEIRNPLTVLKGFLKLLPTVEDPYPFIQIMENELNHIEAVTSDLLALGKPEFTLPTEVCVAKLTREVFQLLNLEALTKCIQTELNVEPQAQAALVRGNAQELKQVFVNVIKNAIEATPSGGKVSLYVRCDGDGTVCIDIMDTGPGMSEETIRKVGTPFYTTKENGTGLGLLVSQQIIAMHHGQLKITSAVGMGTTFSISLPCS